MKKRSTEDVNSYVDSIALKLIFFSVMFLFSSFNHSEAAAMSSEDLVKNATLLRTDISNAYEELKANGRLSGSIEGNDISSVVVNRLPIGTSFANAETILRSAGFEVSARPGEKVKGNRSDRFAVYATSSRLINPSIFGIKNEVTVMIFPNSPKYYETVQSLKAYIYVNAL